VTQLTSDAEGKRVVADGEQVGTVREVENADTAVVEPESDLDDATRSRLNWKNDQEVYRVRDDDVETVTDGEVRLRRD